MKHTGSAAKNGFSDRRPIKMNKMYYVSLLLFFLSFSLTAAGEPVRYEFEESKMAVPVRLVFYAESEDAAKSARDAVYGRFDELNEMMSDYNPESEMVRACRRSGETGEPVEISETLYDVLVRARQIGELTSGAFDISVSPIVKLWRRSRMFGKRPPEDYLSQAKELVGSENWELRSTETESGNKYTLRILKKNVRLDLGGIAKGYAIDEGFRILNERGITSALIDAGGDIRAGSPPPGKDGWTIGGLSLSKDEGAAFYLNVSDAAIASSGDTFQYFEIDGVRYSHIIDPRTCEPLTRHSVVSVLAPDAATADALASGVSVLGPEEGVKVIESLPGVETMILLVPLGGEGEKPEIWATGRFLPIQQKLRSK